MVNASKDSEEALARSSLGDSIVASTSSADDTEDSRKPPSRLRNERH